MPKQFYIRINDYLAAMCETLTSVVKLNNKGTLADISIQVTEKTACSEASLASYVSTESLLPNKSGRQIASSLPSTGKVTIYQPGDTLISNIRPYFKKVWLADRIGTCSGDIIPFRPIDPHYSAYLYSILRSDDFFNYVMMSAKGTKMPRGDKKLMMEYPIARECDQDTLDVLTLIVNQMSAISRENDTISTLRDVLLPKLLSGEIDVSEIELSSQIDCCS